MTEEASPQPRDASEVGAEVARAAWAEAARPVLLEAAGRYRSLVTYKQLAAAVQEHSGITTTQPMHQWLGALLEQVTADSFSRGEPLLSSLCVTVQGSVGQGYADAIARAGGERPADPDDHAANERLRCYQHWNAEGLPRDGGTPLRTAHFTPARTAPARKTASKSSAPRKAAAPKAPTTRKMTGRPTAAAEATPVRPIELCPRCFTQVPASGVCGYCD